MTSERFFRQVRKDVDEKVLQELLDLLEEEQQKLLLAILAEDAPTRGALELLELHSDDVVVQSLLDKLLPQSDINDEQTMECLSDAAPVRVALVELIDPNWADAVLTRLGTTELDDVIYLKAARATPELLATALERLYRFRSQLGLGTSSGQVVALRRARAFQALAAEDPLVRQQLDQLARLLAGLRNRAVERIGEYANARVVTYHFPR